MSGGELRDKVARGVAWSMAEKVGSMLLQLGVSLVLLRMLGPDSYNELAMLTAFSVIALVLVDSGFSQILVRKAEPTEEDYKSVFVFNMVASIVLYVLILLLSPWVSSYYDQPDFARVAPVFFLLLPLSALCSVQNVIFMRQFRFAFISKVTFLASLISGVAAIGLALAGFGLWSIVAQRVIQVAVRSVMLWWLSDWRPKAGFSRRALGAMAPNSLRLMATDLIAALYNKIPQFFIGKIYSGTNTLAYYDQAQKLKDSPVSSTVLAVQTVTYPALSKISNNPPKFAESYRQIMMVVAYVMFPMMLGLSAIAPAMFGILGDKWMPTVPYFEAICLVGLFYPLSIVSMNVLKVKSDGRIILWIEIGKKVLMTAIFAATIPVSVMAVVWGLVAISFCEMTINFVASMRFCSLTLMRLLRTMLPILLVSIAMYFSVRAVDWVLGCPLFLRLIVEVGVGGGVFLILSALFRLEAFGVVVDLIKKQIAK